MSTWQSEAPGSCACPFEVSTERARFAEGESEEVRERFIWENRLRDAKAKVGRMRDRFCGAEENHFPAFRLVARALFSGAAGLVHALEPCPGRRHFSQMCNLFESAAHWFLLFVSVQLPFWKPRQRGVPLRLVRAEEFAVEAALCA